MYCTQGYMTPCHTTIDYCFWFLQKAEDKKRLQGPGLLLIDRVTREVSESEYYLVDNSGSLELQTGSQVAGQAAPLARVLFCSRPPIAEMAEISYP